MRKRAAESSDGPTDSFTPADSPEAAADKPKKQGLGKTLLKAGLQSVLVASSLAGGVAGVGVATNADVLVEAVTQQNAVKVFGGELGTDLGINGKEIALDHGQALDLGRVQDSLQMSRSGSDLQLRLDGDKGQALINTLRGSAVADGVVQKRLVEAEKQMNAHLAHLTLKGGETLLTARVPFPSGQGSILQIAGKSLPVGLRKLAMEDLPLVAEYQIDPVDTGLKVNLSRVEVDSAHLPAGVDKALYLGSVRADISNPNGAAIPLSGKVKVSLDDGTATRKALEKTTDPVKRQALQQRLKDIERLQKLTKDQDLQPLLDLFTDNREASFQGSLQPQGSKMGDGTVHVWLAPDQDGDKRGDVKLSGEIFTAGVDKMTFGLQHIDIADDGSFVGKQMSKTAEGAVTRAVPKLMEALKSTIRSKVSEQFKQELGKMETDLDAQFDQGMDAAQAATSGVGVKVDRLDVDPKTGQLVVDLHSKDGHPENLMPQIRVIAKKAPAQTRAQPVVSTVARRSVVKLDDSKPAVVIPGSTARQFLTELLKNKQFQKNFQTLTEGTKKQAQQMASHLQGPKGTMQLEIDVPFPSQASVKSPVGQLPKLARKTIPFEAAYQVDDFGLPLQLRIKPVEVKEAVRPAQAARDGVFLGAVQVNTDPLATNISGHVQVHKGKTEGGAAWAEEALNKALQGQDFGFRSKVSVGETESIFYLWAVPDFTGDGRADIAVASRSIKSGAESLDIQVTDVNREGKAPQDASLGGRLNGLVGTVVTEQIKASGEQMTQAVSGVLETRVLDFLNQGSNQAAQEVNHHLSTIYSKLGSLDIPVPEGMKVPGGKINLQLGQVKVKGDNIISEYGNERTDRMLKGSHGSHHSSSQTVKAGEVQARVPGAVFNSLLADRSVGGPFDWNAMLKQAAKDSSAVKSLHLAKDEHGKTISPTIKMISGKPTVVIQVDGETNGVATPVSAGARLLPGFLGDGLGWLADNTVGAVLGARLQTEIQVPLQFKTEGDSLKVVSGDVKFKSPQKTDFNIVDVLPTRLLSSLITDGVASAVGPDAVEDLMKKANITTDLGQFGLQWARVEATGQEGGPADFTFGVKIGDGFSDVVNQQVSDLKQ